MCDYAYSMEGLEIFSVNEPRMTLSYKVAEVTEAQRDSILHGGTETIPHKYEEHTKHWAQGITYTLQLRT